MKGNRVSRRSIVRSASIASAGMMAMPQLKSCSANRHLNIAVIGVGGRGEKNWEACVEENIVALWDVDDAMAAMQLGKHVYLEKPLAHDIWQVF